jgi:hypothetical protein
LTLVTEMAKIAAVEITAMSWDPPWSADRMAQ